MRIKVCGITRSEDASVAAEAGADFIGLIRAASRRQVEVAAAATIVADLPPSVQPVLVFMDQSFDEIAATVEKTRAAWVQLHGQEPIELIQRLRERFAGLHIIKACEVADIADGDRLATYFGAAHDAGARIDAILLDAPKQGGHPGYECLAAVADRLAVCGPEVWCAGSLTPENVVEAVSGSRFAGVDVARGVETSPGIKDHDAIRRFVGAVRAIQA